MKTAALLALLAFAPIARAEPDLRPRMTYVVGTSQLVKATKSDPEVGARAKGLHDRRSSSIGIAVLSALIGGGLSAAGWVAKPGEPNMALVWTGAGVAALGQFIAIGRAPEHEDYVDVMRKWNERHPDQPIDVR